MKEGDTLKRISYLFDVSEECLRETNNLKSDEVHPGDQVRIPEEEPTLTVQASVSRPCQAPDRITTSVDNHVENPAVQGLTTKSAATVAAPSPSVQHKAPSEIALEALRHAEKVYHSVVKGDTLATIAQRYDTDLDELFRLNSLNRRSRLSIGQKIIVRSSGPQLHTVKRGETLGRIAKRYGVAVADLVRINRLDGERLAAGQILTIKESATRMAAGSTPPPLGVAGAAARDASDLLATLDGTVTAPGADSAKAAANVISMARTMLGIPYRFGGTSLRGIDCSAYVQRVFGLVDVQLPRTAREQYSVGARVSRTDLEVGDLVFFRTYASYASHVGIYLGDNLFIHASSMSRKVAIDSIDLPYYRKRFLGARRLIVPTTPALAASAP